jgi:hypothetical protein
VQLPQGRPGCLKVSTAFERLFPIILRPSFRRLAMQPMSIAMLVARLKAAVATVSASVASFGVKLVTLLSDTAGPQAQGLPGGLALAFALPCTLSS